MFGPAGVPIGAGSSYTNAIMDQSPSAWERETLRQVSSAIIREDSICIEESEQASHADSWSVHCDRTDQAPYSTLARDGQHMTTQTSLLSLPRNHEIRDLAYFLRTTGPNPPHRKPSKAEHPHRVLSVSKSAFRFFKIAKRLMTPVASVQEESFETIGDPIDEGRLLKPVARKTLVRKPVERKVKPIKPVKPVEPEVKPVVEQKVSSDGRKYLALRVPESPEVDTESPKVHTRRQDSPILSPGILESRVSVSFSEDIAATEGLNSWFNGSEGDEGLVKANMAATRKPIPAVDQTNDHTLRMLSDSSSPIRPAASYPPTPQPGSAVSTVPSYQYDDMGYSAQRSYEALRNLSAHPPYTRGTPSTTAATSPLPNEDFPVNIPRAEKGVEIKHPAPRRLGSHPVLVQRASSGTSHNSNRNLSDSPGLPPKSPLRLRREVRTIEGLVAPAIEVCRATPRIAPSIQSFEEYAQEIKPITPSVTTDCTGPIKRPKSRDRSSGKHTLYPLSRKEREDRTKSRKLRDRPNISRTIDAVVNPPPISNPRQRLRKVRPQIQILETKIAPLSMRTSSSASSNASWKKVTETTALPTSPVSSIASEDLLAENGDQMDDAPVSPAVSNISLVREGHMTLSPVMLVAEEPPTLRTRPSSKHSKVGPSKSYAPRPRSASMSRVAAKRRSRASVTTISRPASPGAQQEEDAPPPLPSAPPNRALPPTPPASGSERTRKSIKPSGKTPSPTDMSNKELPMLPTYEIAPRNAFAQQAQQQQQAQQHLHHQQQQERHRQQQQHLSLPQPHVVNQDQRARGSSRESRRDSLISARFEALERRNAQLYSMLMQLMGANGTTNGPLAAGLNEPDAGLSWNSKNLMGWENRIARRSAASHATSHPVSHAASSSNGSALDMYKNVRIGEGDEMV